MEQKDSHVIRNGVIATVLGGIVLSFWEPFRKLVIRSALWAWDALKALAGWFSSTHDVYGWVTVLLVFLAVPTVVVTLRNLLKKAELGYEDLYKADRLFGAEWHWSYSGGAIKNLLCLCPSCQSELVYSEFVPDRFDFTHDGTEPKTEFICERCGTPRSSLKGRKDYALGTVEREIRRKIRSGEWQNGAPGG